MESRALQTRQRWTRRAQARPDEILDAALDAFIAKGFDAARIEDIARSAGLSKGAIYLYFPSKTALLRELIEREITPIVRQYTALADAQTTDPAGLIRFALLQITGRMRDARLFAIPRLVIAISGRFPEITQHYRTAVIEPARAMIERLISQGIALGQFRKVDLKAATRALIGPMMFEALWTHVFDGESAFDRPEEFISTQIDLLLGGLAAKGTP